MIATRVYKLNTKLGGMTTSILDSNSDSKLTPGEKVSMAREWEAERILKEEMVIAANNAGIVTERDTYIAAFVALSTILNAGVPWVSGTPSLLADLASTSDIDGIALRNQWTTTFNASSALQRKLREQVQYSTSAAMEAAADAQEAAIEAQASATDANNLLADISSDSVLTPGEKPAAIQARDVIVAEQAGIDAQATAYVSTAVTAAKATYDTAVTALTTYLATLTAPVLWTTLTGNTTIDGATFRTKFNDVYSSRQALLNAIYARAKALADAAQTAATNAATEAALVGTTLRLSAQTIVRSRTNTLLPATLTVSALTQASAAYAGRFRIELSHDGITYQSPVYTSASDESSYAFTVPATMVVSTVTYYVASIRVSLFAAGGVTKLIGQSLCSVSLDSSASAIYWGALTSAPASGFIAGDYYWDNNTVGTGTSGTPRIYTGSAWTEYLSSMPGYQNAMVTMLADMGAWATAQGSVVAAASAIFQKLVTADAFIANLFTQSITVGSGGRIRYETGAGVQKRCVQLADEKIDWRDTPDTTPASPELLQARIGRLGVGGAILMDGDFEAQVTCQWSPESTINGASSGYSSYIQTTDSQLRIAYIRYSDNYVCERIWSGSAWGPETVVNNSASFAPHYIQLSSGSIYIAYSRNADGYVAWKLWSGTAWGLESVINSVSSSLTDLVETSDGNIRLVFHRHATDGFLMEKVYDGSSWGTAYIINAANSFSPSYVYRDSRELRVAYYRGADGYLCERVWSGTAWGAEFVINSASSAGPNYIELVSGELRIAYTRASDNYVCERIWSGSAWGAETVVNSNQSSLPNYIQLADGQLRLTYRAVTGPTTGFIVERTLSRYARIGAGIIESGINTYGGYNKFGNGSVLYNGAWVDLSLASNQGGVAGSFIKRRGDQVRLRFQGMVSPVITMANGRDVATFTPITKVDGSAPLNPHRTIIGADTTTVRQSAGLDINFTAGTIKIYWTDGVALGGSVANVGGLFTDVLIDLQ